MRQAIAFRRQLKDRHLHRRRCPPPDFTINSDRLELFLADELVGKEGDEPAERRRFGRATGSACSRRRATLSKREDQGIDSGGIKWRPAEARDGPDREGGLMATRKIALCRWAKYDAETGDITMRVRSRRSSAASS
ncbi:MAG: hypothetical protein R3F11_09205 [Verrucomicrobiales bacterium]